MWSTTAATWVQMIADMWARVSGSTCIERVCWCGSGSSLEVGSTGLCACSALVALGLSCLVGLVPRGYVCLRRSDSAGQAPLPPRGWVVQVYGLVVEWLSGDDFPGRDRVQGDSFVSAALTGAGIPSGVEFYLDEITDRWVISCMLV